MTSTSPCSTALAWARFRFSVVGALLSAPPPRGALKGAIRALAAKTWTHPVSGADVRFAPATIERWYYTARPRWPRRSPRDCCVWGFSTIRPCPTAHIRSSRHGTSHFG